MAQYDPFAKPYSGGGSGTTWGNYSKLGGGSYEWLADDEFSQWMRGLGGGTVYNPKMTKEVYESMSPEDWAEFKKLSDSKQNAFIETRLRDIESGRVVVGEENTLKAKAADREKQQNDLIAKVTAFANEMGMPVSELMQRDEFAQALNRQTYQNTMGAGMSTGAGAGGLSQVNADQATKNALLGYQFQRQQAGQQALGSAYNMLANQGAAAEDIARYNQGLNLQLQQARGAAQYQQYQQGMGQAQGLGGMIGMGLGAYVGGASGAAMGQQIGSGLAGQRYQSANPYNPYKYSYPTSSRNSGSSGLSGQKYGNY